MSGNDNQVFTGGLWSQTGGLEANSAQSNTLAAVQSRKKHISDLRNGNFIQTGQDASAPPAGGLQQQNVGGDADPNAPDPRTGGTFPERPGGELKEDPNHPVINGKKWNSNDPFRGMNPNPPKSVLPKATIGPDLPSVIATGQAGFLAKKVQLGKISAAAAAAVGSSSSSNTASSGRIAGGAKGHFAEAAELFGSGAIEEGTGSGTSKAKVKRNGKLIHLRKGGGKVWEDKTLDEWPENDFRLFAGDIGNEVTDDLLANAFRKYKSFTKAKVVRDKGTGKTRGFGFISFNHPEDMVAALREINGKYIGNRPVVLKKSKWEDRSVASDMHKNQLLKYENLGQVKQKNLKKFRKLKPNEVKKPPY